MTMIMTMVMTMVMTMISKMGKPALPRNHSLVLRPLQHHKILQLKKVIKNLKKIIKKLQKSSKS